MHAQCAFACVPYVARNIACCVIAEFTHGVRRLIVMKRSRLCAASVPLPPVDMLISKYIMFR